MPIWLRKFTSKTIEQQITEEYEAQQKASKEASGISKTMQRMKNNYELIAGFKYGTYRLPEDVKVDEEQYKDSFRTIEKKKYSCL